MRRSGFCFLRPGGGGLGVLFGECEGITGKNLEDVGVRRVAEVR